MIKNEYNYIAGDQERIADGNALSSIEKLLSGLTEGENVEYTDNGTGQGWIAGISGTVFAGSAVVGGIQSAGKAIHINKAGKVFRVFKNASHAKDSQTIKTGFKAMRAARNAKLCKSGSSLLKPISTAGAATIVTGAVLGGVAGNYIGDQVIKYDTAGDFIDNDGNFCENKANRFKTWTTVSGVGVGAAAGAGAALALGLVSNPVGWTVLAVGAVVGVAAGIGSWLYKKFGKKQ